MFLEPNGRQRPRQQVCHLHQQTLRCCTPWPTLPTPRPTSWLTPMVSCESPVKGVVARSHVATMAPSSKVRCVCCIVLFVFSCHSSTALLLIERVGTQASLCAT